MAVSRWDADRGLIGRGAQLELIGSHLAGLDESRGALVLLSGEPGIGKTRLAEATLARARILGIRTGWTTAWQGEGAPPHVAVGRHPQAGGRLGSRARQLRRRVAGP
jgi:hypothetical protein